MADKITVNDRLVRIIGIQLFGFVIPNATGLINNSERSVGYLLLAYAFFMLIAFLIWQGNRYFLFKLQEKYNWFINPAQKITIILSANIIYTSLLVVVMLNIWYKLSTQPIQWDVIRLTALVCVVCVIFVTHVYETVFLIKQRESDLLKGEQLERAKIQAELEALKNQIDPHFMFNSLNSLSYLIDENPKRAKQFTESLAEVYRYILGNKNQRLVLLEDELDFLNRYISLLRLRFEKAFQVNFQINKDAGNQYLIPPISIFIAIENVVKHNELSRTAPIAIDITQKENRLHIINNVVKKKNLQHSSKIGLKNLDERFKIIVGQGIETLPIQGKFQLVLPMLKLRN